jgi:hypothetical protein
MEVETRVFGSTSSRSNGPRGKFRDTPRPQAPHRGVHRDVVTQMNRGSTSAIVPHPRRAALSGKPQDRQHHEDRRHDAGHMRVPGREPNACKHYSRFSIFAFLAQRTTGACSSPTGPQPRAARLERALTADVESLPYRPGAGEPARGRYFPAITLLDHATRRTHLFHASHY